MKIKRDKQNHNYTHTKLYNSWRGMKQRCYDKTQYTAYYQGKNIKVCKEWHRFVPFMLWAFNNGYKDGLTIDRIDTNKNYCPKNCRWVTRSENIRLRNLEYNYKKRKPQFRFRFIDIGNGELLSVKEYADKNKLNYNTFRQKLNGFNRITKEIDIKPL